MICMVYISSATLGLGTREMGAIVKAAQINNAALGITGILLYNRGNFMQLIEGEKQATKELYEKINADRRHTQVSLLLSEPITHRNFENWSMGYKNLELDIDIDPAIKSSFLDEDLNFSIYKNNPYRALQFLETFKKIIA